MIGDAFAKLPALSEWVSADDARVCANELGDVVKHVFGSFIVEHAELQAKLSTIVQACVKHSFRFVNKNMGELFEQLPGCCETICEYGIGDRAPEEEVECVRFRASSLSVIRHESKNVWKQFLTFDRLKDVALLLVGGRVKHV